MAGARHSQSLEVDEMMEQLILKLHKIEAIKFGSFKLKSGLQSPAYIDLRVIISYPEVLTDVSSYIWTTARLATNKFSCVCGVPYTALPIATVMSVTHNVPMLIRRREAKDYGTKKMVEGHYKHGDVCLVVEDVVTSGSSVYETVKLLKEHGIVVTDAVVLLDREQGGSAKLASEGINLHSVFTMSQFISVLNKHGCVTESMYNDVLTFITENRFDTVKPAEKGLEKKTAWGMTFGEREATCTNPVAKKLFGLMHDKQSNLAISVDLTKTADILKLVDQVGSKVCVVKTHVDIIEDFSPAFLHSLQELATKHNFLIFEDRKFADIGQTVKEQYGGGLYKISDWAHIVNAHSVPGPGVVAGLKQVASGKERGCLMIAEMSSAGALAKDEYTKATVQMAEDNSDFVIGFICQNRLSEAPQFIHMTPGVKLAAGGDGLGQQYVTPTDAIYTCRSDVIIVGRGITAASDPVAEAEAYRKAGYTAYLDRVAHTG